MWHLLGLMRYDFFRLRSLQHLLLAHGFFYPRRIYKSVVYKWLRSLIELSFRSTTLIHIERLLNCCKLDIDGWDLWVIMIKFFANRLLVRFLRGEGAWSEFFYGFAKLLILQRSNWLNLIISMHHRYPMLYILHWRNRGIWLINRPPF